MAEPTGVIIAVSGASGAILTALGSWAYNMKKATGENRLADGNAAKAHGDAVTAMSAAAASWMDKYASVIEKLAALESEVGQQRHEIADLRRDFDETNGKLQSCQEENGRLIIELAEAREDATQYLNGFNAARQILNLRDEDDAQKRGAEYEFMAQAIVLETMTRIEKRGIALTQ